MFQRVTDLFNAPLMLADGAIEKCRDAFFDEKSFRVSYLSTAPNGRPEDGSKLIPISPSVRIEPGSKSISVAASLDELPDGPIAVTPRRVRRQSEKIVSDYFGTHYYWTNPAGPEDWHLSVGQPPSFFSDTDKQTSLRSADTLTRCSALAADGLAGQLRDMVFRIGNWQMKYLALNSGRQTGQNHRLVPVSFIDQIFWFHRKVKLKLTRSQFEDAPKLAADGRITRGFEDSNGNYFRRLSVR